MWKNKKTILTPLFFVIFISFYFFINADTPASSVHEKIQTECGQKLEDKNFCEKYEKLKDEKCGKDWRSKYESKVKNCKDEKEDKLEKIRKEEERKNRIKAEKRKHVEFNKLCKNIENATTYKGYIATRRDLRNNGYKTPEDCPNNEKTNEEWFKGSKNWCGDFSVKDQKFFSDENKENVEKFCDDNKLDEFINNKNQNDDLCNKALGSKSLDDFDLNDKNLSKCTDYSQEKWANIKTNCQNIENNIEGWNLKELREQDTEKCEKSLTNKLKNKIGILEKSCNEIKNIGDLDLEKFEKLEEKEKYEKCPDYSTTANVFNKCKEVSENLKDKNIEDLENLIIEIDYPVCKEIVKKRIELLKNNEKCKSRKEKFIDTMKKIKKFDRPQYDEVFKDLQECAGSSREIKDLLKSSDEYIKGYVDSKQVQNLEIDIEYLKVPKYKETTWFSFCKPGKTNPNSYIEVQCEGEGCNAEKIKAINSKLKNKACEEEVVFMETTEETILLEWSYETRYAIKIMDKYSVIGCNDEELAVIYLQTNQLCGYKNFNTEKSIPSGELDGDIKIKIEQRKEGKDGMDCPWEE
ncbi:MAG TPA: hypothetical protein PLZ43_14485 [bacterium]|nr:hypothetical protein [bacterium]